MSTKDEDIMFELEALKRKQRYYRPDPDGGYMGWGMKRKEFLHASAGEHFARSAWFSLGGVGSGETFLNSMGFMTQAQRAAAEKGGIAGIMKYAIPGSSALGLGMVMNEGGNGIDYLADYTMPEIGLIAGWRSGKSFASGAATGLNFANSSKVASGLAGGIAGAAAGLGIGITIGSIISSVQDSNSGVKNLARDMYNTGINTDFEQNQVTLTHRQKALQQLSKSALNDRGQLFGNEAMVLKGII